MKTLIKTTIATAWAAAALLGGHAQAQTLRLNHNLPASSVTGKVFDAFSKRVNELSNGELKVRVFHSGQLGGQRESIELVQQGALDIAKTNAAELEAFDPIYSVFNLPFLMTSDKHAMQVFAGEVGKEVLSSTASKGMVGLGLLHEGCRSFYTTKPVASINDLKGMKIRVQPSPSAIRMVELMGARPTPIAFPELYSALQQGVVDGAENNVGALTYVRHGEVAKHYAVTDHACIPAAYMISSQSWNKLSPAKRDILRKAADEALQLSYKLQVEDEDVQAKKFTTEMGGTIRQVNKAQFQAAVAPMIKDAMAANAKHAALIKKIQALSK